MRNRTRFGLGVGVVVGLCIAAGPLRPVSAIGQEANVFESPNPTFEQMEMRLWKDNFLSRQLGGPEARIHAYVGQFVAFNDNIYLQQDDRKSDTIWTSMAGLDLRLERLDLYDFKVAGNYWDNRYHNHSDSDNTEYDVTPSFSWQANPALKLSIDGVFSKTVSPLIDGLVAGNAIEQYTNGGGVQVRLTPNDLWGVDFKWRINDRRYQEAAFNGLEYTENRVVIAPFYVVSEKTKVGVQLTYGMDDYGYSNRNEPEWGEGCLTLDYNPAPKWVVHVAGGYQDREYDQSGTVVADTHDFNGLVFEVATTYKYTEKWSYTVTVLRTPQEASADADNFFVYTRGGVTAAYSPISPLKVEAGVFTDFVEPSVSADSQRRGGSLGLTWSFCEWSGIGASYQYVLNDSKADGADYRQNITSLGAWVTF